MAELIERLLDEVPGKTRIPIHLFQAILAEWARGKITGAQALDQLEAYAPPRLNTAEQAEAQAIVALVTAIPTPAAPVALGNNPAANALRDYTLAWSQRNEGLALRALKIEEIDQVFLALDHQAGATSSTLLYNTAAEVRSKLGISA